MSKDYESERRANPMKAMIRMLKNNEENTIIAIHNYPNSTLHSVDDVIVSYNRNYKYGIIAGHEGNVIKYKVNIELSIIEAENYNIKNNKFYNKGYNRFEDFTKDIKETLNIDIEEL